MEEDEGSEEDETRTELETKGIVEVDSEDDVK